MRPIKFRAWDDKKKEMVEMLPGDFGRPGFLMDFFVNVFEAQTPGEDNMKLMQFTGLLDKKGNEIYEGDIVRPIGHNPERMGQFVVKYIEKYARFKCDNGGQLCIAPEDWHEREVIGNIYENPNLLKEKE